MRIPYISLVAAGALALGGCAYGDFGYGYGDYGYGYSPYGYGSPYYGGYYGYGAPYFGWYDNFYYPGSGIYVYDSFRRPHVWTQSQRTYWMSRRPASVTRTRVVRPNWSGFDRRATTRAERQQMRDQRRRDRFNQPY